MALLEVKDLRTHFRTDDGIVKAVDGVSFEIKYGQTLGVVGESGCGKSITAMSAMRLIERPGRTVAGEIRLDGRDLLKLSDDEMRDVRGNTVSMIFQEPMTSLNPVYTVGDQIAETVQLHRLRDLVPDREHRVQGRHRLLEDHRDVVATDPLEHALLERREVAALVEDA